MSVVFRLLPYYVSSFAPVFSTYRHCVVFHFLSFSLFFFLLFFSASLGSCVVALLYRLFVLLVIIAINKSSFLYLEVRPRSINEI